MSVNEIQSPSGLDLHPRPPQPVRLSKRAGILFVLIVGVVIALLGYGLYSRQRRQAGSVSGTADDRSVTPAIEAGRRIAQDVPAKSIGAARDEALGKDSDELRAPTSSAEDKSRGNAAAVHAGFSGASMQGARASYQPAPQSSNHEATPEERQLQQAYQREQEAIVAPTSVGQGFAANSRPNVSAQPSLDLSQLSSILQSLQHPNGVAPSGQGTAPADNGDPNMQDRKAAFLAESQRKEMNDHLVSQRTAPQGRYEIKAGWDIPAILEQTINSDLPGEIRALVRENVYDTATGRWLLIPQGARLLGAYDSRIAYGQGAIEAAWKRIIYPDASSIDLEGMIGQDSQGASGFRESVDNHYRRLLAFGLLTSTFSAAFQLSQSHRGDVTAYPSAAETAGTAVGQQMSQLGIDVTRRNLNVQPTIRVHAGYRFNVRVNRDMEFEGPYQPIPIR